MATYVTKQKKLNVPLFIVLLIFAFVPGILYFIWTKFPSKVCTDPEKGNGAMMRIVSAAVAFGAWFIATLLFIFGEGGWGIIFSLASQLAFSLASLVVAVLAKKSNNKLLLFLNILFALATIGVSLWMFWYNWFISVIASIVTIVGCVKGMNHYNYHVLGKKEGWEGAEETPVEETKVEE